MQDLICGSREDSTFIPRSKECEQLIIEHIPQVKMIAQRIFHRMPPDVEFDDLVGAGVLGLLGAAEKFNPLLSVKFKTYAEFRIRGAILDSLRDLDPAPRSWRRQIKQFGKVNRELEQTLGGSPSENEICNRMGLTQENLNQLVAKKHMFQICSLETDGRRNGCEDGDPLFGNHSQLCENNTSDLLERAEVRELLGAAINTLPKKERLVISLYYFDELTMHEIGKVLQVNESRISQLHARAIKSLRNKLNRAKQAA